jgi:hypothetical protein
MSSLEASNLRPAWRFRHISNKQKIHTGKGSEKKMLVFYVGSRYVYENKQNYDKMPGKNSDMNAQLKPILQKIAGLKGQFAHFDRKLVIPGRSKVTDNSRAEESPIAIHKSPIRDQRHLKARS